MERYKDCHLCPRACGVDRTVGKRGYCRASSTAHVAYHMLHKWEEPCLVGENGSGTIFFAGCGLGCVYCQNSAISQKECGRPYSSDALATLFLSLERKGAANINLVTAAHYAPHLVIAIQKARDEGLSLPIVYNTSGFEAEETLCMLKDYIDVYLTDMRYGSAKTAKRYSGAEAYPTVALSALSQMVKQVGGLSYNERGELVKGVVVRFLLLPTHLIEAKQNLKRVFSLFGNSVIYSLMSQYTPMKDLPAFPELSERVSAYEYASFVSYARDLGITNAFVQEGEAASSSFIPPFECALHEGDT